MAGKIEEAKSLKELVENTETNLRKIRIKSKGILSDYSQIILESNLDRTRIMLHDLAEGLEKLLAEI